MKRLFTSFREKRDRSLSRAIGMAAGPILFAIVLLIPAPSSVPEQAWSVVALIAWMIAWWVTEAVPIAVTSLLPALLPPLLGVLTPKEATEPYAEPVIFLMLGGFMIAVAIEQWGLHKRFAWGIMAAVGPSPGRLLLGIMLATAFLSMWISNTATVMMMVPLGIAITTQFATQESSKRGLGFSAALMLGIAFAGSAGGMGTLIGSPPNAIFAGVAKESLGRSIGFGEWFIFALPVAIILLVFVWAVIYFMVRRRGVTFGGDVREMVKEERAALGRIAGAELRVLIVFVLVAVAWIIRPFVLGDLVPNLTDTAIALSGAVLLFLIPSGRTRGERLLDWGSAKRINYGVLILMGGGLSLARSVKDSGLGDWLVESLSGLDVLSLGLILLITCAIVSILTQFVSNTAVATLFLPISISISESLGVAPLPLMATVALAASAAFVTPVATPPNAIVFASGEVSIGQMAKAGLIVNVVAILLVALMSLVWQPVVW